MKWIVVESARLEYNNVEIKVRSFIDKRIKHFHSDVPIYIASGKLREFLEKYKNDAVVVIDIMNPFIDFELIQYACEKMERNNLSCVRVDGAIPGTQFEYILAPGIVNTSDSTVLLWNSQRKYNNQLNLFKYKRVKMFEYVIQKDPDLYKLNIKELLEHFLCKESESLICYGEKVRLMHYNVCPHCGGELEDLPLAMSQAFCGYIPSSITLYHRCIQCGLVVMSPFINSEDNYKIYDRYDKEDFVVSHNNPYTKSSKRCEVIEKLLNDGVLGKEISSLDLGGGCGNFSKYLKRQYPKWNVIHSDYEIKENPELINDGIGVRVLDFANDQIEKNAFDLITAWEVIEHIPFSKFDFAINNIKQALKSDGIFVFSTPDFDSPLCKTNDFFAICPPFHYTVFGTKWLEQYFTNSNWEIIGYWSCSDFLDDSDMWCKYLEKTAPSFQLREGAKILGKLFSINSNREILLEAGYGTEVIFAVKINRFNSKK